MLFSGIAVPKRSCNEHSNIHSDGAASAIISEAGVPRVDLKAL